MVLHRKMANLGSHTIFETQASSDWKVKIFDFQLLRYSASIQPTASYSTTCMLITHSSAVKEHLIDFRKRAHKVDKNSTFILIDTQREDTYTVHLFL